MIDFLTIASLLNSESRWGTQTIQRCSINVITSIKKLLKVCLCYCSMNSVEIAGVLIIQTKIVVHSYHVIQPPFRWERVDLLFVKNEFSWLSVQLFISSFFYEFRYLSIQIFIIHWIWSKVLNIYIYLYIC